MKNILSYAENHPLEALLLALVLGMVLVALVAWLWWRKSSALQQQLADQKLHAAQQLHEQNWLQLQTENEQLNEQTTRQERELLHLNKLSVKLAEQLKQQQMS